MQTVVLIISTVEILATFLSTLITLQNVIFFVCGMCSLLVNVDINVHVSTFSSYLLFLIRGVANNRDQGSLDHELPMSQAVQV